MTVVFVLFSLVGLVLVLMLVGFSEIVILVDHVLAATFMVLPFTDGVRLLEYGVEFVSGE